MSGVASRGSSVLLLFSPTKLNAAIVVGSLRVARVNHEDAASLLSKQETDGPADALGTSGYDGDLILKIHSSLSLTTLSHFNISLSSAAVRHPHLHIFC